MASHGGMADPETIYTRQGCIGMSHKIAAHKDIADRDNCRWWQLRKSLQRVRALNRRLWKNAFVADSCTG